MIKIKYDEIFTYEKIYRAHMRGRLSKRNRKSLVKYEMTMLTNLYELHERMLSRKFYIKRYSSFVVYEPKKREIQTLNYSDRIIQHIICDDVLAPYAERNEARLMYQKKAGLNLRILDFYTETAKRLQAINNHQMEVVAKQLAEVKKMLAGWIKHTKNV